MILTNEQVWCPVHGRMPLSEAAAYSDEMVFGWAPHYCKRCARQEPLGEHLERVTANEVQLVCNGDCGCDSMGRLGNMITTDGFCEWHGNYIGDNPFPAGVDEAKRRHRAAQERRWLKDAEERAEAMGPEEAVIGRRGGIFG